MTQAPTLVVERKICPLATRDVVDRVLLFIQEFTAVQLYTYQSLFCRRIIESILDNDGSIITGLWARQSGKTQTVAGVVIGMSVIFPALAAEFPDDPRFRPFATGFYVGIYAPVMDQATISFERMRAMVVSDHGRSFLNDEEIGVSVLANRGDTLTFSNGSRIIARTASTESQIEGKTHHFVVLEEAQKITRSKVEKEIRPMLASTNGSMCAIGTAWHSRGGFHTFIQSNVDSHKKGEKRNHYEFPWTIIAAEKRRTFEREEVAYKKGGPAANPFHLNYEKYVQGEIHRLGGIDNDEFKMNFRCLWQESRVIAINATIFESAAIRDMEWGQRIYPGMQVAGLDIGKVNDVTCCSVLDVDWENPIVNPHTLVGADEDKQKYRKKALTNLLELSGSFEGNVGQYRMLVDFLRATQVGIIVIDSTGIGDVVYERIEAMLGDEMICISFKFGSLTKHKLYKYYRQEINAKRFHYAAGPTTKQRYEYLKFQREHLDLDLIEYGGYAVCQAPPGGHDDYPDSGALATWGEYLSDGAVIPEIEVVSSASFGGGASRGGRHVSRTAPSGGRSGRYARR